MGVDKKVSSYVQGFLLDIGNFFMPSLWAGNRVDLQCHHALAEFNVLTMVSCCSWRKHILFASVSFNSVMSVQVAHRVGMSPENT